MLQNLNYQVIGIGNVLVKKIVFHSIQIIQEIKKFKVLPHRYLKDYEYSIFIDGNMYVVGDVNDLVERYLNDSNIGFFDHKNNVMDREIVFTMSIMDY